MNKQSIFKNFILPTLVSGTAYYYRKKLPIQKHLKLIVLGIVTYIIYQYQQKTNAYLVYNKNNEKLKQIIEKCPTIKNKKFYPSFIFQSSTFQTLVSTFLNIDSQNTLQFENQDIIDPNNRKVGIYLSWVTSNKMPIKDENKIVFILPGLTGKPENPYIQSICLEVIQKGYKPVVYNYRLFSEKLLLPRDEVVDLVDDLDFTLQQVQKQYPNAQIYGVGHSYGANQLVNYLGRSQESSIIKGAVSLANPYSMEKCSEKIQGTMWNYLLAKILSKGLQKNRSAYDSIATYRNMDVDFSINSKRVYEFDQGIVIQLFGYKSVEDYYFNFQSSRQIKNVKIPLLGISSEDDFIAPKEAVPFEEFKNNENTILMMTKRGGHVGWIEGDFFRMKQWFPRPTMEFLENIMIENDKKSQI